MVDRFFSRFPSELGANSDRDSDGVKRFDQYWLKFKGEDKMQVSLNLRVLEVVF